MAAATSWVGGEGVAAGVGEGVGIGPDSGSVSSRDGVWVGSTGVGSGGCVGSSVGGIGVGVGSTGIGVGLASTRIEAVAVGFGGPLGTDVGGTSVGVVSTGFGAGVAFTGAGAAGPGEDDRKPTTMAALLGTSASRMSRAIMQATSNTVTRTANTTMAAIVYMTLSLIGTSFHPPRQHGQLAGAGQGQPKVTGQDGDPYADDDAWDPTHTLGSHYVARLPIARIPTLTKKLAGT